MKRTPNKKNSQKANFILTIIIFSFGGIFTTVYGGWNVQKVNENNIGVGNYSMSGNRFVFEGYDGNDYEIFYYRPHETIKSTRYNLTMDNGNGHTHIIGGESKLGGKKRIPFVLHDYEILCYFKLKNISGTLEKARLIVHLDPQKSTYTQENEKQKTIEVYDQNKGACDRKVVHYNTFEHCPWDYKIGDITVPTENYNKIILENNSLRELVQRWIDNPKSNDGLILTAHLKNRKYYTVTKVSLRLTFSEKIRQLTNNDIDENDPHITNGHITWNAKDGVGTDTEIFYWNGSKIIQITKNDFNDFASQVSPLGVVWEGYDGTNWDIYLWSNGTSNNISNNGLDHYNPRITQEYVTWNGGSPNGSDDEIFFYDGVNTLQLTNNDYDDFFPEIDGSTITWQGYDGTDTEIFYWNTQTQITTVLTNNLIQDSYPHIYHNTIVWTTYDNQDNEIMYWDGSNNIPITDNSTLDISPWIDKKNIVWSGADGTDRDIFYYDGTTIEKVYDNDENDDDPQISNKMIIWKTYNSSVNDFDLYLAQKIK